MPLRTLIGVFLIAALAGCAGPKSIAEVCQGYGFEAGTEHYAQCVQTERMARAIEHQSNMKYLGDTYNGGRTQEDD